MRVMTAKKTRCEFLSEAITKHRSQERSTPPDVRIRLVQAIDWFRRDAQ